MRSPVPAILVRCFQDERFQHSLETVTDAEGEFVLDACPSGRLRIAAYPSNGSAAFLDLGKREAGVLIDGVRIDLHAQRVLSGRVSREGHGVPATVVVIEGGELLNNTSFDTKMDGSFAFHASRDSLGIVAYDVQGRTARVAVPGGEDVDALTLELPAGGELRVRVEGATEEPRVLLMRNAVRPDEAAYVRERISPKGKFFRTPRVDSLDFVFDGIEAGRYFLQVDTQDNQKILPVTAPFAEPIVVRLEPRATLDLQVVAEDGSAVDGAAYLSGTGIWRAARIEDGHVKETGLPPGEYQVAVRRQEGVSPVPTQVALAIGENHVRWLFPVGFDEVRGVVQDRATGIPISDVAVALTIPGGEIADVNSLVRTDKLGWFSIQVADQATVLAFEHPGYRSIAIPASDAHVVLMESER